MLGLPDARWGQRLVVVYPGNAHPDFHAVIRATNRLADYKRPKSYIPLVGAWPTTASGKLNAKPVVVIDPGHGGLDPGAVVGGVASLQLPVLRVAVTEAPAAGGFLEEPWRALVGSARALSDEAIQTEYDDLFGGVGKPEIFLYGSHYLSGFLNEKPLIKLRDDLAELGLARDEAMSETEDHFACLCEVMRYLIAGDDVAVANLTLRPGQIVDDVPPS